MRGRVRRKLAVGVGELGELLGEHFVPRRLILIQLLEAEELDVRLRNRPAADGVGHEIKRAAIQGLLDDRRIA